jgi:hypothetical protein
MQRQFDGRRAWNPSISLYNNGNERWQSQVSWNSRHDKMAAVSLYVPCPLRARSYNIRVSNDAKSRVGRQETLGILLIAVLILVIILVRFGRHIPWSAR